MGKQGRKALSGTIVLVMVLSLVIFSIPLAAAFPTPRVIQNVLSASPTWWDSSWRYRKSITISNDGSSILTDYQTLIKVDTAALILAGKMRSDAHDLRFVTEGNSQLSYWIESGVNTTETRVWVKVPSIPALGTTTIYMYYGNPNAASASNGSATFEFFDDFDGGLGKWSHFGSPTPTTFQNSEFHDGWGYSSEGDSWYPSGSYTIQLLDLTKGIVVEARQKQLAGNTWDTLGVFIGSRQTGYTESGHGDVYCGYHVRGYNMHASGDPTTFEYHALDYDGNGGAYDEPNDGAWHRFTFTYDASTTNATYYRDGVSKYVASCGARPYDTLPIVLGGRDYHNSNFLDYVIARKYAAPEPTYSFGSEEQSTVLVPTTLSISPSSFILSLGKSRTMIATLKDSANNPLAGKTIIWSATLGSVSPSSATTDSSGQVMVTYTAPGYETSVTVTASFAGDTGYQASSGSSSGGIIGGPLGLADSPWPKFRHDLQNTGRSPYVGVQNGTLGWSYTAGGAIYSSPAIGTDGTVYVGSSDNKLYAINPNGTLKWSFTTGGGVNSSPAIGADGTVYVGSNDGKVYAINSDGTLKWSYQTIANVHSSPAIDSSGIIYVAATYDASWYGRMYALYPDGTTKWVFKPTTWGSWITSSPTLRADGTILFGDYTNPKAIFWALNPDNTVLWTTTLPRPDGEIDIDSTAALDSASGKIHFGGSNHNRKIFALSSDGTILWSYLTGGLVPSSPAIGIDGTVYVGSMDGKLYAISPDGTLKWSYQTGGGVQSSPAIGADGTIYVGSNDGKLYALTSNGSLRWSYTTGGAVASSPAIGADGKIYVGSNDGRLYCFKEAVEKTPTALSVSPSTFELGSGKSKFLTATLTVNGVALAGKTVTWSATSGSVSLPSGGTTDSSGRITVVYTAPTVTAPTVVTVTASFAGDADHKSSSGTSSGIIEPIRETIISIFPQVFTLYPGYSGQVQSLIATLRDGDYNPLAGKTITWSATLGSVSPSSATTDPLGQVFVVYTAPTVTAQTPQVTITASFAGDAQYEPISGISSGVLAVRSENISASTGGTVVINVIEINVTVNVLVVPPNALPEDTAVTVVRAPPENLPDYAMVSHIFEVGPSGTTFTTPSTLTLPYDENEIPEGVSEDDLAIYRRAGPGKSWEKVVGNMRVDKAANTVSVDIDHLSEYAVMAQLPTQPFVALPPIWIIVIAALLLVAALIAVIWRYLSAGHKEISEEF